MQFESLVAVLEFAVRKEEEAAEFYTDLARSMVQPHIARIFEEFAAEEMEHKRKILIVMTGRPGWIPQARIKDLHVADIVEDVVPSSDMGYQQALILAMKAEKAAYLLYMELSSASEDDAMKDLFYLLAQEEARHRLRFEVEYDEQFSGEN
ncbi:MAG: ferritin family protein [Bacteroidetes bacterium]|nr:ferritin family protein [Bacteroidota bacterium]